MSDKELRKVVQSTDGATLRKTSIKMEAYWKPEDETQQIMRKSKSFSRGHEGLLTAIKWKTETVRAWKDGKLIEPSQANGITLSKAVTVADEDVNGWAHCKSSHRESSLSRAQVFIDRYGANRTLESISYQDLIDYRKYLKSLRIGRQRRQLADASVNQYLLTVSKMFTICSQAGYISKDYPKIPLVKIVDTQNKRYFRYDTDANGNVVIDEEAKLYELCEAFGGKFLELKMLIQLGVHTGLRIGEICGAKCDWINFRNSTISVPATFAKTKKDRNVLMNDQTKAIVRYFMNNRIGSQKLIKSHFEAYLKRDTKRKGGKHLWDKFKVAKYFNKLRDRMGLSNDPKFTYHSTRYTHITRLLEQGIPPHVVMKWVGHGKLETTMGYVTTPQGHIDSCAEAISAHPATARNTTNEATVTVDKPLHTRGQWKQNKFGKKQ